jgi:transposase-like protein
MNEANPVKPRRRKYDKEFKRQVIQNWISSGKSAEEIGKELGISPSRLYEWRHEFAPSASGGREAEGAKPGSVADLRARLDAAERELGRVREQRDILKKTLGILSEPPANATNESKQ